MKKFLVSLFIIVALVVYGQFNKQSASVLPVNSNSTGSTTNSSNSSPSSSDQSTSDSSGSPTSSPSKSSNAYKDGSYTGNSANAFYGDIQVQAKINGGKITDVVFLKYPNDAGHSIRINQEADPILSQEAISAQSAQVDIVSGATDTSEAFIESLQSALEKAKG